MKFTFFSNSSRRNQQLAPLGMNELIVQEQTTLADQVQDRGSHVSISTSAPCEKLTLSVNCLL